MELGHAPSVTAHFVEGEHLASPAGPAPEASRLANGYERCGENQRKTNSGSQHNGDDQFYLPVYLSLLRGWIPKESRNKNPRRLPDMGVARRAPAHAAGGSPIAFANDHSQESCTDGWNDGSSPLAVVRHEQGFDPLREYQQADSAAPNGSGVPLVALFAAPAAP